MASHGRIPGLVTQDRPRAVKEPCRGHRRPVHPHAYGADAGVPGTARRKAGAVITLPPSLPAPASALPGHPPTGRGSLVGQRTDRPDNDVPGSEPSPAQARTGHGWPIPRDEPAGPLSEPCAPIANATGCPACISMHCSRARKCALMPRTGYSPETSCSWPPRLRRFRGNALCTLSQGVSAETRICPQAAQERPVMPRTGRGVGLDGPRRFRGNAFTWREQRSVTPLRPLAGC